MKLVFPVSAPMLSKFDVSSVYMGSDSLISVPEFKEAMTLKSQQGAEIIHFGSWYGGYEESDNLKTVVHYVLDEAKAGKASRSYDAGALVFPKYTNHPEWSYTAYNEAALDPDISVIAIASEQPHVAGDSTFDRLRFIKSLVDKGLFCSAKSHILYGVPNPAELGMYSELFTSFIQSTIKLAICSTCFIYSVYGADFSPFKGVLQRIPEVRDADVESLGLTKFVYYEMDREQIRHFYLNVERVLDFASGGIASVYRDAFYAVSQEECVYDKTT